MAPCFLTTKSTDVFPLFSTSVDSTLIFVLPSSACRPSPLFWRVLTKVGWCHWTSRTPICMRQSSPVTLVSPRSLICPQETGRKTHLSMEASPFWLRHCRQTFYQTLGSCSSSPASVGCLMYPTIDDTNHAQASVNYVACTHDLSVCCHFRLGFIINLKKLSFLRWYAPSWGFGWTGQGVGHPLPAQAETIVQAAQGLLGLTQVSAQCLRQVTGLLATCHALVSCACFVSLLCQSSSDLVNSWTLVSPGTRVPVSPASTPPPPQAHTCPHNGCMLYQPRECGWVTSLLSISSFLTWRLFSSP